MSMVFQLILGAVLMTNDGSQMMILNKGPTFSSEAACIAASKEWEAHVKNGSIIRIGFQCLKKNAV